VRWVRVDQGASAGAGTPVAGRIWRIRADPPVPGGAPRAENHRWRFRGASWSGPPADLKPCSRVQNGRTESRVGAASAMDKQLTWQIARPLLQSPGEMRECRAESDHPRVLAMPRCPDRGETGGCTDRVRGQCRDTQQEAWDQQATTDLGRAVARADQPMGKNTRAPDFRRGLNRFPAASGRTCSA